MLVAVFLSLSTIFAHRLQYSPFPLSEYPRQFPVTPLTWFGPVSDSMDYGLKKSANNPDRVLIRVTIEEKGTSVESFDKDGSQTQKKVIVSELHSPQECYIADLNRDGKIDYVVEIYSGGNGLAAEICDVVFILSSQNNYRVTTVNTMSPSEEDFLDLFSDGRCQFLHTAFVDGYPVRGRDGNIHNYWVYNILEVTGDTLRISNSDRPGFPKWILFTYRPNHTQTDQLTDQNKLDLWQPQADCIFWTQENPCKRGAGYQVVKAKD